MKLRVLTVIALSALFASSCGTPLKVVFDPTQVPLPSAPQADSIAAALIVPAPAGTVSHMTEKGPELLCFAMADSGYVRVSTVTPVSGGWEVSSDASFPCFSELGEVPLKFASFTEAPNIRQFGGRDFVVMGTLRTPDGSDSHAPGTAAARDFVFYGLGTGLLEHLSFEGKYLADGRLEGVNDRNLVSDPNSAQMRWAVASFAADETLLELSQADLLTDQAVQWWLQRNPDVFTSASRVTFGALSAESSLVGKFKSARKEDGNGYRAAMFDYRGYTVIVAQRKSGGDYLLAWAEPVCVNKNRDRLLNNIYFESGSNLVLFYYHGRRTYKYRLNLANTRLTR